MFRQYSQQNTTAVTNTSHSREGSIPKLDDRVYKELQDKIDRVDSKISSTKRQQYAKIEAFVNELQKELQELSQKYYRKEEDFKYQIRTYGEKHRRNLEDIIKADHRLKTNKANFIGSLRQQMAQRM